MVVTYLYSLVVVAGGAVLALEILGTRVLGPFYGVSLFLWSALITVTLVALSLGYVAGGRWADRGPRLERLCLVVGAAGIWTLLIPWLKRPVLLLAEPFGLRFAVLAAAFLLFALPLALLGMVGPYAIRLRVSNTGRVGRTTGDLFALSTMGSVAAALLTGFVWIPSYGVNFLLRAIGLTLLLLAAAGLLVGRSRKLGSLGLLLAAALPFFPGGTSLPRDDLLALRQSPYAEIRVLERGDTRYLLIDGGTHTIVTRGSWEPGFSYVDVLGLARNLTRQPGKLLLVGLGGGSVAKDFSGEGWSVTAIEIDPVVAEVAREFFGLKPEEAEIHLADGRRFLLQSSSVYDTIVLDAFGSSSIPFHLVSSESFQLMSEHLAPDGVLALNIETPGWDSRIVRALSATLKEHFQHVFVLPAYRAAAQLGNVILLATRQEPSLQHPLQRNLARGAERWRIFAWDNRILPQIENLRPLTDDLNPVDLWSETINYAGRIRLHDYFRDQPSW